MALDVQMDLNLRTTVRYIYLREFVRIAQKVQYQRFVNVLPSGSLTENYVHRINGAVLEDFGEQGGGVNFEEPVLGRQSYINHVIKGGLELPEAVFSDLSSSGIVGGEGIQLATEWLQDETANGIYFPQRRMIQVLRAGEGTSLETENNNSIVLNCYDDLPLFSLAHPYNFKSPSIGTFPNLFTGSYNSDTGYPGFAPLAGPFGGTGGTDEITPDEAWDSLWLVIAFIRTIKQADGVTPRFLEPTTIIHGPRLTKNVSLITDAKFFGLKVSGGAGAPADVQGTQTRLGLKAPIEFQELGGLGDEDFDWYIVCEEQAKASQVGAIAYGQREPFRINMYSATSGSQGINLELAIEDKVKWIAKGRSFAGVGFPQFIFKVKVTAEGIQNLRTRARAKAAGESGMPTWQQMMRFIDATVKEQLTKNIALGAKAPREP